MQEVVKSLGSENITGSRLEVVFQGWQPARPRILNRHRISHLLANAGFEARWKWYTRRRGVYGAIVSITSSLFAFALSVAKTLFRWKASKSTAAKTVQLTRKHNSAWSQFLESDSDCLLVLEDDALLLDGWKANWISIQRMLLTNKMRGKLFVSLGKGFELDQLGTLHFSRPTDDLDGFTMMSKPFANTACAYLLNRELVESLATYASSWPNRMLLNADFLLSDAMSRLTTSSQRNDITCLHATNPVFDNASLAGEYSSSLGT